MDPSYVLYVPHLFELELYTAHTPHILHDQILAIATKCAIAVEAQCVLMMITCHNLAACS